MPATLATPSPLEAVRLVVGIVKSAASLQRCLIGQIKLTRIHVLPVFLPGVRVKRDSGASLYDVERSGRGAFAGTTQPNFVSLSCDGMCGVSVIIGTIKEWWSQTGSNRRHPACKAGALPAELWPHFLETSFIPRRIWLARVDSNHRPHAYQACALTT